MIRLPLAGNVLAYFHYLMGLHLLGHEVIYLEESGWPGSCYEPATQMYGDDPASGIERVSKVMADYGLKAPLCYINSNTGDVKGVAWNEVKRMLAAADLLLNIGGVCWLPEFRLCHSRIYIDMDPLFTQVGRFGAESLHEHHMHFSYGVNIGKSGCTVPDNGIDWHATLPPVVPEMWDASIPKAENSRKGNLPFTTVANWNAYGSVTYEGERYGQKDEELLRLLHLPRHTSQKLELSLSGVDDDQRRQFQNEGWLVRDAGHVSRDMKTYRDYIKKSRGELSVAKNAYVKTRSGWFSDRSVCYMASGRPVILQDTGFSDYLTTGDGVLPFSSTDEAARCIDSVNEEYGYHSRAARLMAENTFSYRILLPNIIERGMGRKRFFSSSIRKEKKQ
jgi:hypothetical protein